METIIDLSALTTPLQEKLNSALSNLTRQQVNLSLKNCGVTSITKVHDVVMSPNDSTTAIYIPIMGDVTGDIFVLLPQHTAGMLADLMIGNPVGSTTIISEFEKSALKELGNITTGVIVTEIANQLKLSMMLTVPNLATDMVGALIDQVLIEYGEISDELLALNFPFQIKALDHNIDGAFVLFFDKPSTDIIHQKISQLSGSQA